MGVNGWLVTGFADLDRIRSDSPACALRNPIDSRNTPFETVFDRIGWC
jgi:hypothetical protein